MDKKYSVKTPTPIFMDLSKAFDNLRFNILLEVANAVSKPVLIIGFVQCASLD